MDSSWRQFGAPWKFGHITTRQMEGKLASEFEINHVGVLTLRKNRLFQTKASDNNNKRNFSNAVSAFHTTFI